jgi:hypothetical protein
MWEEGDDGTGPTRQRDRVEAAQAGCSGHGEKLGRGAAGCTEEYKGLQRTLADRLKQKKRKEWGRRRKIDLKFFEKGFKQMNSNINSNSSNQK